MAFPSPPVLALSTPTPLPLSLTFVNETPGPGTPANPETRPAEPGGGGVFPAAGANENSGAGSRFHSPLGLPFIKINPPCGRSSFIKSWRENRGSQGPDGFSVDSVVTLRALLTLRLASAHVSVHPRVRGSVNVSVCAPWEASGLACPEEQYTSIYEALCFHVLISFP